MLSSLDSPGAPKGRSRHAEDRSREFGVGTGDRAAHQGRDGGAEMKGASMMAGRLSFCVVIC
jgi:hypothetical protein